MQTIIHYTVFRKNERGKMPFDAQDLKVAFEDGRKFERQRILDLLRNRIITDVNNGDQRNNYVGYVKEFNAEDHWDIGEL
jgi:hypothetical protein